MSRRGSYVWAPFESLYKTSDILREIKDKKKNHPKPILSEDDINYISDILISAYHTKNKVYIKYYYNGLEYIKEGIIVNIKNNKIYFNDHTSLYFEQILKIKEN